MFDKTREKISPPASAGVEVISSGRNVKDEWWSGLVCLFMLLQMYSKVDIGETLSVDAVSSYLKRKFPKANAERILGVDSEYDDKRKVRT